MIVKAALITFRQSKNGKELLLVRAHGKPHFVFPGGKQEAGETIEEALRRELQEELGVAVKNTEKLGTLAGHTPDGRELEMNLFAGDMMGDPKPQAEIKELAWMTRSEVLAQKNVMTPMFLDYVIPFLTKQGIW